MLRVRRDEPGSVIRLLAARRGDLHKEHQGVEIL